MTAEPDAVFVWAHADEAPATAAPDTAGVWSTPTATVTIEHTADGLQIRAASPADGLSLIALRWREGVPERSMVLGDAWERSYGELGWMPVRPERVLPWYWLATSEGGAVRGAGVRVRPGSMAFWNVDVDGVTLWLDVRSGAAPVRLGSRILDVATVVEVRREPGDSAFAAQRELMGAMCSDPMQRGEPLVGSNNWYYAYGVGFDADAVVRDAQMIAQASDGHAVRPFCVIDAGWSRGTSGAPGGPWGDGRGTFSDMSGVADRIRAEGARPGLWFRPLLTEHPGPLTRDTMLDGEWPLDPSRPDVLDAVRADAARFVGWGYDLIKHDFSTFDTLGHFVPTSDLGMARVPWGFADTGRTTAEVITDLYRAIREGAGPARVLGCNTIGHLAAGLVDAQRIGDDTSGRQWERTRRMGVNTLAFRLAQDGAFFRADADCVAATPATPWQKNRQFLDLVAQSGTALFVSIDPRSRSREVDADLHRAVQLASDGGEAGGVEPLDWQWSSTPRRWRVGNAERTFDWAMPWGVDQSLASI